MSRWNRSLRETPKAMARTRRRRPRDLRSPMLASMKYTLTVKPGAENEIGEREKAFVCGLRVKLYFYCTVQTHTVQTHFQTRLSNRA
jgi:hypothetical protein